MAVTQSSKTPSSSELIESTNPATGEVIGTVPNQTPEQVNAAIRRAREAAEVWTRLDHEERREQLFAWRRALAERAEDLAEMIHLENGKTRADAMAEVLGAITHLHHAATRAEKIMRPKKVSPGILANFRARISYHALGVVGVIGPWNYPILTPLGSIAYALAAGNTVVFKPSELTPLTGQMFVEIAQSSMSIANVLQIVTGDGRTGAALARGDIDKIAFTGSTATGKKVMMAAAENLTPVLLELGGKDAMIVDSDADVDRAAQDAVYGAMANTGQACVSIERCYVHRDVYQPFVDRVLAEVAELRVGEHFGPMTMASQVDVVREHIEDAVAKGAQVLTGGVEKINGRFIEPTVLVDVTSDMKIMQEETFGPLLPIARINDADEGVELANGTSYGLGSAIFGRSRVRALADRIYAGMTSINSVVAFAGIPSLPFGGVGESGFGRVHGDEGLLEFTRSKATCEERFALPVNLLSFKTPDNIYDQLVTGVKQLYGGGVVSRVRDRIRGA